jgi:quercetin dioxygenase-like cupin family protein
MVAYIWKGQPDGFNVKQPGKMKGVDKVQEQIQQVAARIKELRELFNVSVDSLAETIGISKELYEEYEGAKTDIPVGVLAKIAHRFNVELATLITGEEPRLHTFALTRKGKGASVERQKAYKYQSLAHHFVRKKAEPFLVTVEPGADDMPVHLNSHPGQEFNYVLEGDLLISVEGHEMILHEGDSLFFDSNAPHGMKALNGKAAKFLAIIL